MKIYILASSLLALAACNSAPPPANTVQEVASNNMIADDVTEVQDETAVPPPVENEVAGNESNASE